jgi:hypothetical protein
MRAAGTRAITSPRSRICSVARPLADLHGTLLHLLGLNDDKLRYFHEGRYK